jgi:hypothetical protein
LVTAGAILMVEKELPMSQAQAQSSALVIGATGGVGGAVTRTLIATAPGPPSRT